MKKILFSICTLFLALGIFSSCNDSKDPTYLDGVSVSTSMVSIPVTGGQTSIEVTTTEPWVITCCDTCLVFNHDHVNKSGKHDNLYDWLTISPTSGNAGTTTVTFSADNALDGRTAELQLYTGDKVQRINVVQGVSTISDATCKDVIDGPDSKTYRVKGTCTSIANTTYGNWYLDDGTGQIYIYGTLDAKGATKNFLSLGIEVGDVVTVTGPKTTYNGTVELVDVTVEKIEKSLIKCDSLTVNGVKVEEGIFPLEGGEITAHITCKGNGVSVKIPEESADWLSIAAIDGGENKTVTFRAAANAGGDRGNTVTFETTQGGKTYTSQVYLGQKGAIVAATCAEFNAAPVGDSQYRITGVIQSVANPSYGNIYIRDYTNEEVYVYGIGSKGDFEKLGLKVGDIVTIVGKRGEYKGTAQMTGGQYENHVSVIPCTVTEFLAQPDSKDVYYMVTGDITNIANTTYGNLYLTDGESEVYVYGCYPGWGASGDFRKGWIDAAGIEVGDRLTMIGYKDTYNGTIELCGGTYFSHTRPNQ